MLRVPRQVRNYSKVGFKSVTYSSLTACALSQFIKVNEELLNTDSIFGREGLESALNIVVFGEGDLGCLERTWVAMSAFAHVLGCVTE